MAAGRGPGVGFPSLLALSSRRGRLRLGHVLGLSAGVRAVLSKTAGGPSKNTAVLRTRKGEKKEMKSAASVSGPCDGCYDAHT